jgi:hypothetical protein
LTLDTTTGFIMALIRPSTPLRRGTWRVTIRAARESLMKRLLLISVICLLFVGGWGHVLAAAVCPNTQDMPGCHMQTADTSAPGHEGMEMGGMRHGTQAEEARAGSLGSPLVSCCASRPEVPPAPVAASRGAERSKQDPVTAPRSAPKAIAPPAPSFAPAVTSRQHAPPGDPAPRHVLIQVFLI